jgi:hypothetical protein
MKINTYKLYNTLVKKANAENSNEANSNANSAISYKLPDWNKAPFPFKSLLLPIGLAENIWEPTQRIINGSTAAVKSIRKELDRGTRNYGRTKSTPRVKDFKNTFFDKK